MEGQTEQSIEGQLRVCHNYAKQNGFTILNEYIDRAKTAQNDNQPNFQRMLTDSAQKGFSMLLFMPLTVSLVMTEIMGMTKKC